MASSVINVGSSVTVASDGNNFVSFNDLNGDGKLGNGENFSIGFNGASQMAQGKVGADGNVELVVANGDPHLHRGLVDGADAKTLIGKVNAVADDVKDGKLDDATLVGQAATASGDKATVAGGLVKLTYIGDFQSNATIKNDDVTIGFKVAKDMDKKVAVTTAVDQSGVDSKGNKYTFTVKNMFNGDGTDKDWGKLQTASDSQTLADTTQWGEGRALNSSQKSDATILTRFDKGASVQVNTMLIGEASGSNTRGWNVFLDVEGKLKFSGNYSTQNRASIQNYADKLGSEALKRNVIADAALGLLPENDDDKKKDVAATNLAAAT